MTVSRTVPLQPPYPHPPHTHKEIIDIGDITPFMQRRSCSDELLYIHVPSDLKTVMIFKISQHIIIIESYSYRSADLVATVSDKV